MHIRKIILFISLVGLCAGLFIGCGSDDDGPVYDTAANPYQLPQMALDLIDSLANDRLLGLDNVATAFGNLYSSHGELLDRSDWKKVIDRMGGMFKRKADSLKNLGLNSYTGAAEYYRLASFARPNNDDYAYQARSFGAWLDVNRDSSSTVQEALLTMRSDLGSALIVAKAMLAGDSAAFRFYHDYLEQPLKSSLTESGALDPAKTAALGRTDQALALAAGFVSKSPAALARFDRPKIELLAARVDSSESYAYDLELYFRADERITSGLTISLNIGVADTTRPEFNRGLQFIPVELRPRIPATAWPPGEVIIVKERLTNVYNPTEITLGLFENSGEAGRYLKIEAHDGNHLPLNVERVRP